MSIPENNITNESVIDIQKHIGNKNNKPKQILGEKKKTNYLTTGLKIGAGVLGSALISGLSYKYRFGVNSQPISSGMSYGARPFVEQTKLSIPISEFPSVPT